MPKPQPGRSWSATPSEPNDQLYGDRHGAVKDPGGNTWWIATHIEDVSEQELARRMAAAR
ncbi:MAG TPA: hypothetical protein VN757_12310 [Steroidobacteraceae bacterium]|nr:hypothetical protein [Steroidobacteraceae bacterium]